MIVHKELSYKIMEACFEVHNILGPGFPESIYENAVVRELDRKGIANERQKVIAIYFKGDRVGESRLALVVEGKIILELEAVTELNSLFEAQLFSYLRATGLKLGILVNFGEKRVQYKRIIL